MRAIRWTTSILACAALTAALGCSNNKQAEAGSCSTKCDGLTSTSSTSASTQQAMNRIKSLAGNWVAAEPEEGMTGVVANYRVTSNGSTVVETLFPGTEHEMVTMYHLDNDSILCTHYCAMNNQPRMACKHPGAGPLKFELRDCTNVSSDADARMGRLMMDIGPGETPATLRCEWSTIENGKAKGEPHAFSLVRRSW